MYATKTIVIVIFILAVSGVQHSQNEDNLENESSSKANPSELPYERPFPAKQEFPKECQLSDVPCADLSASCFQCNFTHNCVYGNTTKVNCFVPESLPCSGPDTFEKSFICRFCYQTEHWEHTCVEKANCNAVASPRHYYRSNCTVHSDIICLGQRTFHKNLICNWTGGYRWSTALILSVTLGGFGADRFYLGHWQEGIGKLFSFGGLGVWTLVDVMLIGLRYLGPADGSLYI